MHKGYKVIICIALFAPLLFHSCPDPYHQVDVSKGYVNSVLKALMTLSSQVDHQK